IKTAHKDHLDIMDVFTPFPVHGLDPILGLKESRLHYLGFIYGAIGALFGFGFMSWAVVNDWPIVFGGKPYWPVPSYIPITFEMTVLFAAWGMTITFYTICGMWPGVKAKILDNRITDDQFCLAFDVTESAENEVNGLKTFFSKTNAAEVHVKTI
ncbi:MAG: DUF3341 domain-containing protein, partial [Thermoanaerobaculia bacterium]|nr:DUF3341 domain-containing protein [Thermoanaerobaculia bacterium]